jgi:hypothetical protein
MFKKLTSIALSIVVIGGFGLSMLATPASANYTQYKVTCTNGIQTYNGTFTSVVQKNNVILEKTRAGYLCTTKTTNYITVVCRIGSGTPYKSDVVSSNVQSYINAQWRTNKATCSALD